MSRLKLLNTQNTLSSHYTELQTSLRKSKTKNTRDKPNWEARGNIVESKPKYCKNISTSTMLLNSRIFYPYIGWNISHEKYEHCFERDLQYNLGMLQINTGQRNTRISEAYHNIIYNITGINSSTRYYKKNYIRDRTTQTTKWSPSPII